LLVEFSLACSDDLHAGEVKAFFNAVGKRMAQTRKD